MKSRITNQPLLLRNSKSGLVLEAVRRLFRLDNEVQSDLVSRGSKKLGRTFTVFECSWCDFLHPYREERSSEGVL